MADERISVEVAYALPHKQKIVAVQLAPGTTARDAVRQSGIAREFPGLDVETADLGLYGKAVKPEYVVAAGDRIEVYRPLKDDPKEARRARAAKAKAKKSADDE